ncbi:MAG: DUF58 domain-containing protein [Planctomycetia bacterium]|nr:DUF58 domain-containing protein [Planctomycetia bacterium]
MRPTPLFLALFAIGLVPAAMAARDGRWLFAAAAWDAALLLLLVAERAAGVRRSWLEVERTLPDKVCVGEDNACALTFRSFAWLPLRVRAIEGWPAEFEAEPGELGARVEAYRSDTVSYVLRPGGRGEFTLGPVQVRVRSPLGLIERRLSFGEPVKVRVYPNLKDLRRYDLLSRRRLLAQQGIRAVRKVGEGREFERLREYSPGDEFRTIDWKATARRRRPVSRVHETERGQNVLILLDAGRLMAAATGGLTKLDYAINAALMLGYVALRNGDRVGLSVFSSDVESFSLPRAGRAALARLMDVLVPLQPRLTFSNYRAAVESVSRKMRRRALVVMYTDLADPEAMQEICDVFPLLRRSHLPLCVSFRDPALLDLANTPPAPVALYEHVAAMEMVAERRQALGRLRTGGVSIVDVPPEEVAVASVNRYLRIKRMQAI